ncbi:hypothetical protein K7X08_015432 [Anisodus acutangulus]|uniref:Uncharacterized protein n=1 Tax=Anisodus acutangulus TaxID=402998 RepID=A0A9Q1L5K4_9SOLA|nr:hypothetical protein K7X08_015432 [Anisodus acutangulus]
MKNVVVEPHITSASKINYSFISIAVGFVIEFEFWASTISRFKAELSNTDNMFSMPIDEEKGIDSPSTSSILAYEDITPANCSADVDMHAPSKNELGKYIDPENSVDTDTT